MWNKFLRLLKSYYLKIIRSNHSLHKVSMAVALGIFIGCFIPPGLHTVVVIALAFILRVDKLISFAATWIANPYTMPILYPTFCYVGSRFIDPSLTFRKIENTLFKFFKDSSWDSFKFMGEELILSFMIGGFIFGLSLGLIGYFITYALLKIYRAKRRKKHKLRKEFYLKKHLVEMERKKKTSKNVLLKRGVL